MLRVPTLFTPVLGTFGLTENSVSDCKTSPEPTRTPGVEVDSSPNRGLKNALEKDGKGVISCEGCPRNFGYYLLVCVGANQGNKTESARISVGAIRAALILYV